ncbi:hypothetical protein FPB55_24705 [Pseudomonas sp. BJP69]|nr:hypothetical protein FPB55_24705 [Pseudomonas sp. BJP69]
MALNRCWGLRGLARSHRYSAGLETCAVPVGAGKPAKRPDQAEAATCVGRLTCGCEAFAAAPSSIAC